MLMLLSFVRHLYLESRDSDIYVYPIIFRLFKSLFSLYTITSSSLIKNIIFRLSLHMISSNVIDILRSSLIIIIILVFYIFPLRH